MHFMSQLSLKNKRVLIREDLNVPIDNHGNITSDLRIQAALPTLKMAIDAGAAVIVMSHLGRPTEGKFESKFSLAPVVQRLSELLGMPVRLVKNIEDGHSKPGQIVLLENVRFNIGEENDDVNLAKKYAALCDIFVMDAFATAHRAHASTHGVAQHAKIACAGPLLQTEIEALTQVLEAPQHPLIAIVGGSKVSTKLLVLNHLIDKVDQLIVGGGIANTFIAAQGYNVGKSLYEPNLLKDASDLLKKAQARGADIPLPIDVIVAKSFSAESQATIKNIDELTDDDMILDIGPKTSAYYRQLLNTAKTIMWNGPVGVFEFPAFEEGTKALAQAIADSSAFTVAGGGDTLAAIDKYHVADKLSYISTGGGAFLELLEGKQLPGISALE
jgi:phosphoglycerate kinase